MQNATKFILDVAKSGLLNKSKLEARSVHSDSEFLPTSAEQWQTGPSDLKVLEEEGTELLPLDTLLPCRAAPLQPRWWRQSPSGEQPLQPWGYSLANTPCLCSQVSSGSSHRNSSSLSPVKGRFTPRAAGLTGSRGGAQPLQLCQHKKSETQLITEIAVWLNSLFPHIPCCAKSLPLALSSLIKCFPKEIFLIIQININWSGFKNL